jgi:4,5-DOPA dioxygenase extradiol
MPLLGDEGHKEMVACLQKIAARIRKPSAIIVISAHWEEDIPTITSGMNPPIIYDYYGFPEESYHIKYLCPGAPLLASQLRNLLENAGIDAKLDAQRGFDHGLYVPLKIMFPDADIPCVQLSLVNSLDPAEHLNIGQSLQDLDYENLLVIGSGFSFHNMKAFFTPETNELKAMNESFESWLLETCSNPDINEVEREQRFIHWTTAPYARFCHPREEHLLPLHVCYGLARTSCAEYFELRIMNIKSSMYLWSEV